MRYLRLTGMPMSGYSDFLRLRLAKAATALLGPAPRTGHPVARRFTELLPFPIRSTVLAALDSSR
jgi:hypothetical protein